MGVPPATGVARLKTFAEVTGKIGHMPFLPRSSLTQSDPLIMGKDNMVLPLITVFRVWSGLGCHGDSQVSTLKRLRAREIRVRSRDEDGSSEQKFGRSRSRV